MSLYFLLCVLPIQVLSVYKSILPIFLPNAILWWCFIGSNHAPLLIHAHCHPYDVSVILIGLLASPIFLPVAPYINSINLHMYMPDVPSCSSLHESQRFCLCLVPIRVCACCSLSYETSAHSGLLLPMVYVHMYGS